MTAYPQIDGLRKTLTTQVIGQPLLVDRLLIALLADGHLLVEGPPGLAKTRAVSELANGVQASFQRIQFTPDVLPADLTGTVVYYAEDHSFRFQAGPLFNNLILADEINRAPAKAQSALLEAMAERQITVNGETHKLPPLFLVMATQNPLEQEGTYPLPEAQLDRFLMKVVITYPEPQDERLILKLVRQEKIQKPQETNPISTDILFAARREILSLHMAEEVESYMVRLIMATRKPQEYDKELEGWVAYGASPRGTLALDACSRAHAWLNGRDYVSPMDVQAVIHDVLRHRILLSFEAEARGTNTDEFISLLLDRVIAP